MQFLDWLTKTMETRLVVRVLLDPRPGKNEFRVLLAGCGSDPNTGKVGGVLALHANTQQQLDEYCLHAESAWQEDVPLDAWFRGATRVQHEYVFKFRKFRGHRAFPGYLPLCHPLVIDSLACIRGILMGVEQKGDNLFPENLMLLRSMIRQLEAMSNEAYRLSYGYF